MILAALPAGIVYSFLWFVPPSFNEEPAYAKFIYYLCMYFAFQALLTVSFVVAAVSRKFLYTFTFPFCLLLLSSPSPPIFPLPFSLSLFLFFFLPSPPSLPPSLSPFPPHLVLPFPPPLFPLMQCIHVPYTALTMHLSHDSKERDSATLYREPFPPSLPFFFLPSSSSSLLLSPLPSLFTSSLLLLLSLPFSPPFSFHLLPPPLSNSFDQYVISKSL